MNSRESDADKLTKQSGTRTKSIRFTESISSTVMACLEQYFLLNYKVGEWKELTTFIGQDVGSGLGTSTHTRG